MSTSNSNVIVYVKQPVDQGRVLAVSKAIGTLYGVVQAVNSKRTENAICVDYDPAVINSQYILQCVCDQGVTARLVGI
jgi:copper chaperone CopZ